MLNRVLTLWFMLGVGLFIAGCGNESQSGDCTSALQVDLDVLNNVLIDVDGVEVVINEVLYEISGNGLDPTITGPIDTSDPNATASVEVFGLDPGEGYLVELEATSEDGETTCRGSADFDVTVGIATEVHVLLRCSAGQRFGAVRANGWFNICSELIKGVVSPLQTSIGNSIIVTSQAEDDDGDTIEYHWTAMTGSFANPNEASTFYTCDQTGPDTITITVTDDGGEYCTDAWSVEVECVDDNGGGGTGGNGTGGSAGNGTGGSGGSGTGGSGGSGTGGSGGGGATGGTGGSAGSTGGTGGGSGGSTGTGGGNGTGGSTGTGGGNGTGGSTGTGGGNGTGGTGNGSGTGGTGGNSCQVIVAVN